VEDPVLQARLCDEIIGTLLADNTKTRWMQPDGSYARRTPVPGEPLVTAQEKLLALAAAGDP
ncbi:MAG: hypothetical protein ACREM6_17085, partial [Vulcanimicrobiaceae bacterium]